MRSTPQRRRATQPAVVGSLRPAAPRTAAARSRTQTVPPVRRRARSEPRTPADAANERASARSRVFPIPALPSTRTNRPSPDRAASSIASSAANSASRSSSKTGRSRLCELVCRHRDPLRPRAEGRRSGTPLRRALATDTPCNQGYFACQRTSRSAEPDNPYEQVWGRVWGRLGRERGWPGAGSMHANRPGRSTCHVRLSASVRRGCCAHACSVVGRRLGERPRPQLRRRRHRGECASSRLARDRGGPPDRDHGPLRFGQVDADAHPRRARQARPRAASRSPASRSPA